MSVFNYFSKIVTGFQSKNRTIEGILIRYKFSGKPILFDPIEMLRDLKLKISEFESGGLNLSRLLENIEDEQLVSTEEKNATVIASFKFDERNVKIVRSVKTTFNIPNNRYEFFLDGKLISVFQRQYDFGSEFVSILERMEFYATKPQTQNGTSYYWFDGSSGQGIYLEKIGHTQTWQIHDSKGLEEIWRKLVPLVPKNQIEFAD